jgi:hypothetical protein
MWSTSPIGRLINLRDVWRLGVWSQLSCKYNNSPHRHGADTPRISASTHNDRLITQLVSTTVMVSGHSDGHTPADLCLLMTRSGSCSGGVVAPQETNATVETP